MRSICFVRYKNTSGDLHDESIRVPLLKLIYGIEERADQLGIRENERKRGYEGLYYLKYFFIRSAFRFEKGVFLF